MSQKIHIITYGDKNFQNSKNRLYKECIQTNWFDTVQTFGPEDLTGHFKKEFNKILLKHRGAGYWIWKYDIIKQQLTKWFQPFGNKESLKYPFWATRKRY